MGNAIRLALEKMAGVHGHMALALERKQPVNRELALSWAERLRAAAAEIENVANK